jgi:hypothetical protein
MTVLEDLGKQIQEIVVHEINIITDSEWFGDLVAEKVEQVLNQKTKEV